MISLADISSNKNVKRPLIVAFFKSLRCSADASQVPNEVNNQTAFFNESKEQKVEGLRSRAKEKCTKNKQNKYLGVELFKDLDQV